MSGTIPLTRWFVTVSILSGVLFICAGRTHARMLAAYLAVFAGTGLVAAVSTDPSLDIERRKPGPEEIHPNSRRGAATLFLVTVLVAALDAGRFHWITTLTGRTQLVALAVLVPAACLQVWATIANPFFSTAIRVQTERGHNLITGGPYRFIRHPGYLAMMIAMPATALVLGSLVALIPAFFYSALILWRTKGEDQFLARRLVGYTDYAALVRHRLIPRLW